ncbi:hypothetical protein Cni_G11834 [Canna indica]|uniref:Uncharacterized protein n=1 Tax=Canna indica TaxID=4628 RepID=A0AAQ3K7C6_9LILI|nr:hypothetical protein Cni_G11834 [Canna indica]
MEYLKNDSSGTDDDIPHHGIIKASRGLGCSGVMAVNSGPITNAEDPRDMEFQIHRIEMEAYGAVLRAFNAQSDVLSWGKEGLISELRKELRVSDVEHREILGKINSDDSIKSIRQAPYFRNNAEEHLAKMKPPFGANCMGSGPHKRLKHGYMAASSSPKYLTYAQPSSTVIPPPTVSSEWPHMVDYYLKHTQAGILKARGSLIVQSSKMGFVHPGMENLKPRSEIIEIRATDKLILEVERICGVRNPDPAQLQKAKLILKMIPLMELGHKREHMVSRILFIKSDNFGVLTLEGYGKPFVESQYSHVKPIDTAEEEAMQARTVRVANISDLAEEREIREFFSFSGDIEHIEIQGDGIQRVAFVTFKDPKALEIALLLSGATIVDQIISITPAEDYVPRFEEQFTVNNVTIDIPIGVCAPAIEDKSSPNGGQVYASKAHNVVAAMLAKGSAIRQDALNKAKAFDEKHRLMATASEKVISFDKRVGFSEKITIGISVVNEKVKSVDQKLHVSDKTMAALTVAEQKLNDTGAAVKTSRYIAAGTAWFHGAFGKVAKAGHFASTKTREKFQLAVTNLTAKDPILAV